MKPISLIAAAAGLAALAYQPAVADCVDVTGSTQKDNRTGIAKDGTHAPLEENAAAQAQPGPATGTTTTSSDVAAAPAQKDGENVPLGESPDVATSGQDAQAQQQGKQTAAAAADQGKC